MREEWERKIQVMILLCFKVFANQSSCLDESEIFLDWKVLRGDWRTMFSPALSPIFSVGAPLTRSDCPSRPVPAWAGPAACPPSSSPSPCPWWGSPPSTSPPSPSPPTPTLWSLNPTQTSSWEGSPSLWRSCTKCIRLGPEGKSLGNSDRLALVDGLFSIYMLLIILKVPLNYNNRKTSRIYFINDLLNTSR